VPIARGEFSIVIAGLAVAAGLHTSLGPLATTYVLALAVLGPLLAPAADPRAATLARPARSSLDELAGPAATAVRTGADAAPSNDGNHHLSTP
jgi:CPA2 family monovalent cation:H+ antiporter-2